MNFEKNLKNTQDLSHIVISDESFKRFILNYFDNHPAPFDFDRNFNVIEEAAIAQSCLYLLETDITYFRNKWPWSKFISKFFFKDTCTKVKWYAAHCIAILFNLSEVQLNKILENLIGNSQIRTRFEVLALRRRYFYKNKKFNQELILNRIFGKNGPFVNIEGIFLPKILSSENNSLKGFIDVESTKQNCKKIALGLASSKSVLVQGPVGSAKTSLVEYLAIKTGHTLGKNFFKIQLGDQIDSKSLLGTYHCTNIPGEFVWRPGLLTQAVTNGYWLLMEDIDCANLEIITILSSLLENKSFSLQGFSDCLPLHPGFQLFFTQRLLSASTAKTKINLIEKNVLKVTIEPLTISELQTIILRQYPHFKTIIGRIIEVYQVFQNITCEENSRFFSVRDLFKWCSRSSPNFLSQQSAIDLLQNAMDVFIYSFPKSEDRIRYSKLIFKIFGLADSQAVCLLKTYKPVIELSFKYLKINRVQLLRNSPETIFRIKMNSKFAYTRQATVQLEQIAYCVNNNEPILLVGETGTGKTTSVQYLAEQLGRKLVVINMNQQSDSKDLLGGYKPVDLKLTIKPLKNEFFRLYKPVNSTDDTFKIIRDLCNQSKWLEMIKHMHYIIKTNPNIFTSDFKNEVEKFKRILEHDSKMMFAFIEGSLIEAVKKGDWVLLDEINLATADTLECLSSLLDDRNDNINLLEMADVKNSIKKHHDFRLFACMNPATDVGKKDLPIGLRNRFTEFFVEELTDENDLFELVKTYLKCLNLTNQLALIVKFYLDIRKDAATTLTDGLGQKPHFSLRTLCRALFIASQNQCRNLNRSLYEAFCLSFLTQLDILSYKYVETKIRTLFAPNTNSPKWTEHKIMKPEMYNKENYIEVEGYWIYTEETRQSISESNYILTNSFKQHLKDLARIVSLSQFPVLLQGDTGVGKTRIIEYLAEITKNKCYRINNHENITIDQYIGTYIVDKYGQLVFREGLLIEAMRNGYWIILDELNLAPSDVLEALNRVLDDNRELRIDETQDVVKAARNFRIFATQNPPGFYGGRKLLSKAFRNRFIELHFNDIPSNELKDILCQSCQIPTSRGKKMVEVMHLLQVRRRVTATFAGKKGFMTLRDLFRWGERYNKSAINITSQFFDWDQHLVEMGYLILAGRVRKPEELKDIIDVMQEIFKRTVNINNLFSLHENTSIITKPILEKLLQSQINMDHKIIWTFQMRKLAVLVSLALEQNEPVLLVGETGGGKTTVCQILAEIRNQKLMCVNCHMNMESADFIGGLRPTRDQKLQEQGHLFEWCDGPLLNALQSGSLFLVDEINLVEHSALERLNSLLETERSLLVIEKGDEFEAVFAKDGFQFVGTMNPGGDYGKKELSPALRNRFTEIWCEVVYDRTDFELIIVENLNSNNFNTKSKQLIANRILDFIEWFKSTLIGSKFVISVRDVLTWVCFINSCSYLSIDESLIHGACLTFLDSFGCGPTSSDNFLILKNFYTECLKKFNLFSMLQQNIRIIDSDDQFGIYPFTIEKDNYALKPIKLSLKAPTILQNFLKLLRAMQLRKAILLEGDPGVGKTRLVSMAAQLTQHQLVRINVSKETEFSDLIGAYYPKEGGKSGEFIWKDGLFLKALKDGAWILIDELNLASQSVLEGLNACLDHRAEVFIPEIGKSFHVKSGTRIFGCQNPLKQGGSRKGLPKSFLNRFTQVYINQLNNLDLCDVLSSEFPLIPYNLIEKLVEFNSKISDGIRKNEFGFCGGPWEFNLRDLSRWCEALVFHKESNNNVDFNPSATVNLIYWDRMRSIIDRKQVEVIFREVFNENISGIQPLLKLNDFHVSLEDVNLDRLKNTEIVWINNDSSKLVLKSHLTTLRSIMFAVNLNWMSILIGPNDSMKKDLVETLAKLARRDLQIISVNTAMDITDLLGGYEQSNYNRKLEDIIIKIKRIIFDIAQNLIITVDKDKTKSQLLDLFEKWEHFLKLLEKSQSSELCSFVEQISALEEKIKFLYQILQLINEISNDPVMHQNLINRLNALTMEIGEQKKNSKLCNSGGKFEWIDSVLIKCLQNGNWLLIENANFCNAAVFDRLNCLLEPNGVLIVNEKGTDDNTNQVSEIKPHPDFRLILTMDPKFGEISRAMRNRGVEIYMHAIESYDFNNLDIDALLSQNGLQILEHRSALRTIHNLIIDASTVEKPNLTHLLKASSLISQQIRYNFPLEESFKLAIQDVYVKFVHNNVQLMEIVRKQFTNLSQMSTKLISNSTIELKTYHNNTQVICSNSFNFEKLLFDVVHKNELLMNTFINSYQIAFWNELQLNYEYKNLLLEKYPNWESFNREILEFLVNFQEKYYDSIEPRWISSQSKVYDNKINTLLIQLRMKAIQLISSDKETVSLDQIPENYKKYSLLQFSHQSLLNKADEMITRSKLIINYEEVLKYFEEFILNIRNIDNDKLIDLFVVLEWWRIYKDFSRMQIFDNFEEKLAILYINFYWFRKSLRLFNDNFNLFNVLDGIENDLKNFDDLASIEIVKNYWKYLKRPMPIVSLQEKKFLEKCDSFADKLSIRKLSLDRLYKIFNNRNLFDLLTKYKLCKNLDQINDSIKQLYLENIEDNTSYSNILCITDYIVVRTLSNLQKHLINEPIESISTIEVLKKYLFNANLQRLINQWPNFNRNEFLIEIDNYFQNSVTVKNIDNLDLNIYNPTLMYNTVNWIHLNCTYGQLEFYKEKLSSVMSISWEMMIVFQDQNYDLMKNSYEFITKSGQILLKDLLNDSTISTSNIIELVNLVKEKVTSANYNKYLIELLNDLQVAFMEINEGHNIRNLATIYSIVNYLKLQLNCQLPIIDPLMKVNFKKDNYNKIINNLQSLKTSMELQHQQLCNYSEITYPLYKPLEEAILSHGQKLDKISKKDCERLKKGSKTYQNLVREVRDHLKTMGLMHHFLELLKYENALPSILINKCQSWINAQDRFRLKLNPYKYIYKDLIHPILEASIHFSHGLKLLLFSYNKISNQKSIEDKYALNLPKFLTELVKFPATNFNEMTSLCFDKKFRQFFLDYEYESGLIEILRSNLFNISNNFLITYGVNNEDLLIKLFYLINKFVDIWKKQDLQKRKKIAEDQSLYKFKIRTLDDIIDEDNSEDDLKEFFTNYHEKDFPDFYVDHLNDPNTDPNEETPIIQQKSIEIRCQLTDENFELMCKIHVELMLGFSQTKWLKERSIDLRNDFCKPLMIRYEIFKVLMNKFIAVLDNDLDKNAITGFNLLIMNSIKSIEHNINLDIDTYNFYKDSNVSAINVALVTLKKLRTEVNRLLNLYPEQPTLCQILLIIDRIQSFPITSSVARFLTGFEVLLSRWFEWCENSPKNQFKNEVNQDLTKIVIDWRKLELTNWKNSLNIARRNLAEKSYKLWINIYNLMIEFIKEKKYSKQQVIDILQQFMETSNLAEFENRLKILLAFHCHLSHFKFSVEQKSLLIITWNIFEYYNQFLQTVEQKINDLQKPIEKNLKNYVSICQWNDINYWSVKNTVDKTHKTLHKFIKEFEVALKQCVKPFLVIMKSDSVKETFNFVKMNIIMFPEIQEYNISEQTQTHALKAWKILNKSLKKLPNKKQSENLNYYIETLIETINHLSDLKVNSDLEEAKRKTLAKSILQQKKQCLSEFFKTMVHLGLSYRRGLVERQKQNQESIDFLQLPLNVNVFFSNYLNNSTLDEHFCNIWSNSKEYYMKCVAKLIKFDTMSMCNKPVPDFGAQNLQRCLGFAFDLMAIIRQQRKQLSVNSHVMYKMKDLESHFEILERNQADEFFIISMKNYKNLIHNLNEVKIIVNQYSALYESHVTKIQSDLLIKNLEFPMNLNFHKILDLTQVKIIDVKFANFKLIENKHEFIERMMNLIEELNGLEQVLKNYNDVEILSKLRLKLDTVKKEIVNSNIVKNKRDFNEFLEVKINKFIQKILLKVQAVYKMNNSKTISENDNKFEENHLTKSMIENIDLIISKINLSNLVIDLERILKRFYKNIHVLRNSQRKLLIIRPYLEIIGNFYKTVLSNQLINYRLSCKMLSIMLNVFCEFATNGFCMPKDIDVQEFESDDMNGMGLVDGTGDKDVSDRIESEDQLDEAKPQKGPEENDNDDKDELGEDGGGGIDMNEDFDGQMENVPGDSDKNDSDDEDKSDNEDLDQEMGDVDEASEKLDDKIWNDADNESENNEEDDDEEEKENKVDEDSKKGHKDKKRDGKRSDKDDNQKTIDENNSEFDSNEIDPYNANENQYPEPEQFEIPDSMDFDDDADDNNDNDDNLESGDDNSDKMDEDEIENDDVSKEDNDDIEKKNPEWDMEIEKEAEPIDNEDKNLNNIDESDALDDIDKTETVENNMDSNIATDHRNEYEATPENLNSNVMTDQEVSSATQSNVNGQDLTEVCQSINEKISNTNQDQNALDSEKSKDKIEEAGEKRQKLNKSNQKRKLGIKDEPVIKKAKILESDSKKEIEKSVSEITNEYQHINEEDNSSNTDHQVVDGADKEQYEKQKITSEDVPEVNESANEMEIDESKDVNKDEEMIDKLYPTAENVRKKDFNNQGKQSNGNNSDVEMDTVEDDDKDFVELPTIPREDESSYHTKLDDFKDHCDSGEFIVDNLIELRKNLEKQLLNWTETPVTSDAEKMWSQFNALTNNLAQHLAEQLRLVLEPMQASKLEGDYRTGRRINMRKIIPYIASNYRKDKIWLRRTKPFKRDYSIVIAIDDSSSMEDNNSKEMTFESLALISKALSLLECGQLAVLSYGEKPEILHKLSDQFTDFSGAKILQKLQFQQQNTLVGQMLEFVTNLFNTDFNTFNANNLNSKLLIVISDGLGIFTEGKAYVKRAIRRSKLEGIFTVFIILDNPDNTKSILGKRRVCVGKDNSVYLEPYLDEFPFPFYIILRNIESLPYVLSEALKQWFELIVDIK